MIRDRLPSKRFMTIVGSIALLGIIFGLIAWYTSPKQQLKRKQHQEPSVTIGEAAEKDSDGDGLVDWREKLFGFDPFNPDTNGNGIGDLAEAQAQLDALAILESVEGNTTQETLNETNMLARDLFITLNALSPDGPIDQATYTNLTELVSIHIASRGQVTPYQEKDLSAVRNTPEHASQYSNTLAEMLATHQSNIQQVNAIALIEEAAATGDPAALAELERLYASYSAMHEQLLSMPVPNGVVQYHLEFLNTVHALEEDIYGMQQFFDDPILTLSALFLYNEHLEQFASSLEALYVNYLQ